MSKVIIYLDSNIYQYLKKPRKDKEKEDLLFRKILEFLPDPFQIIYSPAHMNDLYNGWDKTELSQSEVDPIVKTVFLRNKIDTHAA